MTYKHLRALINSRSDKPLSPKDSYTELFQQTLSEQFYNAQNWYTIQEETYTGSGVYRSIDVRIAHVINTETGLKMGDDWKTLLFKEIDSKIELGKFYMFDNNVWLTVNTEIEKNLTGTVTIRRCNNTLRWIQESTGQHFEVPCAIEYLVKEPRDYFTSGSPFPTPGGFLQIHTQFNEQTNLIKENQRFLFGTQGHWTCYKVIGTGLNDFKNEFTYDRTSPKILNIDVIANFVNPELDDMVNGYADMYTNLYELKLNFYNLSGEVGDVFTLVPTVIYNNRTVTRDIEWSSDDEDVAIVLNGKIHLLENGTAVITAQIKNNPVVAECVVVVEDIPTNNIDIKLIPDKNYVLEGKEQTYEVYFYEDDVVLGDAFVVTCANNNVPNDSFEFVQVDDNSFTIKNIRKSVDSYLSITCTTGLNSETFNIQLKGKW